MRELTKNIISYIEMIELLIRGDKDFFKQPLFTFFEDLKFGTYLVNSFWQVRSSNRKSIKGGWKQCGCPRASAQYWTILRTSRMLWAWAFLKERTFTTLEIELKSGTPRKLLSWDRKKTHPRPSSDAILIQGKHYCEVSEISLRQDINICLLLLVQHCRSADTVQKPNNPYKKIN